MRGAKEVSQDCGVPEKPSLEIDEAQVFRGYTAEDIALVERFRDESVPAQPGFLIDFVGSRIRTSSLWASKRGLDGQKLGLPIPRDYCHAEAIEWVGLVKSVAAAKSKFAIMELGAGFGPWCVAGAVAARSAGISDIRICAVEADPDRYKLLVQHLSDNGIDPAANSLHQAAVGARSGTAIWPVLEEPREDAGARPLEPDRRDYRGRVFAETRQVPVISFSCLLGQQPIWDLAHVDVQGSEFELCAAAIGDLNARVKWMVIATHSRKLDGDVLDLFWQNGWQLENEKPSQMRYDLQLPSLEVMTTQDGAQVWRNRRL